MKDMPWGGPDRYYAEKGPISGQLPVESDQERELAAKLEERFPDLRERVERAFKESNVLLREQLRVETGLRLSVEDTRQTVPVKVVDGLPVRLINTLIDNPVLIELYLDLKLFKATCRGITKVAKHNDFLRQWPPMTGELTSKENLKETGDTIERLVQELGKLNPFKVIWDIDEDILGAYFFRKPRIELYWIPIGLIAAELDISPEALTKVVTVHELAHAYTHIGFDTDNHNWDVDAFAQTSAYVVEGLAQFYTEAVCRRLEPRHPELLDAYKKFLEKQSGPYRVHDEWAKDVTTRNEIIRNSMVQCRSVAATRYESFLDMIDHHKDLIGQRWNFTR